MSARWFGQSLARRYEVVELKWDGVSGDGAARAVLAEWVSESVMDKATLGIIISFKEVKGSGGAGGARSGGSAAPVQFEPSAVATNSAALSKELGVSGWGLYALMERGARGTHHSVSGVERTRDEVVAVMEGSLVCRGDGVERDAAAVRCHNAHPDGWNPFLIELENGEWGSELWWGGHEAAGVPEVGAHMSNDARKLGELIQNGDLLTGGVILPVRKRVILPVTRETAWDDMAGLEVLVEYGEEYWAGYERRYQAGGAAVSV